jgi:hypothetical protein
MYSDSERLSLFGKEPLLADDEMEFESIAETQ